MISATEFFGKGAELTISALAANPTRISLGHARCWAIEAATAGKEVAIQRPSDHGIKPGFPKGFLLNKGATHDWDLTSEDGTVLATVSPGEVVTLGLTDDAGQGSWQVQVKAS